MNIPAPLQITPRLLPGMRIGNGTISVDADANGIVLVFDIPAGEFRESGLRGAACHGGRFESLLHLMECATSFLSACAESRRYASRNGGDAMDGENAGLFCEEVGRWSEENSSEIEYANFELQETIHPTALA